MKLIEDDGVFPMEGTRLKKHLQRKKILSLLYQQSSVSAPYISRKLGMSLPTALLLLNELVELDWVELKGAGKSSGGRKPTMFGISRDSVFVIACELGRFNGKLTIFNGQNQPVVPLVVFATHLDDPELIEIIHNNAKTLIENYKINESKILAVGLTMPGLVDEKKGLNLTIKNEKFRNVKERLEKKFGKLVYINNDARIQAFGEFIFGAAKGHSNAVVINWNWGIGMGIIANGKLYNGSVGFAGEFSHIKIVEEGNLCICGKRGCLETIASACVLVDKAIEGIRANRKSQLTEKFRGQINLLQPENIIEAAKLGDEFSIALLNNLGLALGKGLSIVIQLLNPEIIVIGGLLSEAKQHVFIPILQSVNKFCLEQILLKTEIVLSDKWSESGLLGINAMLFHQLLNENHNKNQI